MSEVAKKAGVSRSAVSLVLNGRAEASRIADSTRQRIEETALELGYRPNALARAIVSGQTKTIGFLTEEAKHGVEFKARILSGVLAQANESGYLVKMLHLSHEQASSEITERCLEWRLSGLIATSVRHLSLGSLRAELKKHGLAMALIEDGLSSDCDVCARSDESIGLSQALTHLRSLGHNRIAFLGGSGEIGSQDRAQMMAGLALEHGFSLCGGQKGTFWGDWWDVERNTLAANRLLDEAPEATAVLCAGDISAGCLLHTARRRGLVVPRDLSIVGFGDHSYASYYDPPLSTIAQSFDELAKCGTRALFDFLEHEPQSKLVDSAPFRSSTLSKLTDVVLPTHFLPRGSTGPVR